MKELVITHQQALENLSKQKTPEAKAILDYVRAVRKKDIAVLGTDEAFILRDKGGEIRAFKTSLTLSVQNGGLVNIQGQFAISAQGFEKWATKVGASIIFPKKVAVGLEVVPNPHPIYDKDERIIGVIARAVAFCYSPMGIPQVSDWTTLYSPPSYKMVDLFAKAKKFKQCFRLLPNGAEPEQAKNETWAPYPFDQSVTFWVNTAHDEVFDWYSQVTKRELKSMDTAQTFVKRNAFKHLSGLQKAPHDNWTIPILAWRATGDNIVKWDGAQYAELQDKVADMIEGGSSDFKGQQIEYHKGESDAHDEEFSEALEAEVDPEDSQETGEKTAEPEETQTDEQPEQTEPSKNVKQAMYLSATFPAEFDEACKILKIDVSIPVVMYHDSTASKVVQKVGELVDAQQ